MASLIRGGVHISFDVHGAGPPLLLSHGYSASARMWDGQCDAVGRRVITWDMRGHGRSDSPDDPDAYSEAETVADMVAILDECGIERAAVGGLSLGGYMSLAFHAAHPERTAALLLFDTGPGYRNEEARAGWNAMAVRLATSFEAKGLDALSRSPEVQASEHRSARGLALAARGILVQHNARVIDGLPHIAVPALVLVGANDDPYVGPATYMAAKIPGAQHVVLPDAGHASNLDQPVAFNQAVVDFLDGAGW